ncbi:TPA: hypothetical protein RKT18_001049 [Bacillus cereus]|nr:hypothetical protein [Bacillus cereus]
MEQSNVIQSPVGMEKVNQDIEIYSGKYTLELGNKKVILEGHISLKWLPQLRIEYEGKVVSGREIIDRSLVMSDTRKNKVRLSTPNGYKSMVMINKINYGTDCTIAGVCLNSLERLNGVMDSLYFSVVNFIDNFGDAIKHERMTYSGRMYFEYGDFKITVDKQPNYKKIYEELDETGGYIITHVGVIENIKGENFTFEQVEVLLEALFWLLSFASGRQVGICSLNGYNEEDLVLEKYQTPIIGKWTNNQNWFPRISNDNHLRAIYPILVEKLSDDLWGEVLKRVFTWYFDSMGSTYIENKIVAVQIALEMLAWTFIVEENEIIERNIFDNKLRASDKLRLMLYEFSIPREIPDITSFDTVKSSYRDGAHLFTDFRNEIVHPKKAKQKGNEMSSITKYYALQLGRKYLELGILRILNYQGKYQNLLSEKEHLLEIVEYVPWASNKS